MVNYLNNVKATKGGRRCILKSLFLAKTLIQKSPRIYLFTLTQKSYCPYPWNPWHKSRSRQIVPFVPHVIFDSGMMLFLSSSVFSFVWTALPSHSLEIWQLKQKKYSPSPKRIRRKDQNNHSDTETGSLYCQLCLEIRKSDLSTLSSFCLLPRSLQLLVINFVVFTFSFFNFVLTLAMTKKIRLDGHVSIRRRVGRAILSSSLLSWIKFFNVENGLSCVMHAIPDVHVRRQAWSRTCNFVAFSVVSCPTRFFRSG